MSTVVSSNIQHDDPRIRDAYRLIADYLYDDLGRFAYQAFDFINASYFDGRLPETLILWHLTDYGHFLGWCRSSSDGPPIILLHPSVVYCGSGTAKKSRFNIDVRLLGFCYAFDVLLHECIHAHVEYNLGGWARLDGPQRSKWTYHNNPLWVGECNRIAELLGYSPCYEMKRYRRVNGRLKYTCGGPDFERFPHTLPGRDAFYEAKQLPFEWESGRTDSV